MSNSVVFKSKKIVLTVAAALSMASYVAHADEAPAAETLPEYTFMDAIKTGKNLTSFRVRYEYVQQDGNAVAPATGPLLNANALTLRSLVGWQTAPYENFSFAAQLIDVSKLNDDYNDGTSFTPINAASNQPDKLKYARVVDPDYTNFNLLFVDWTGLKNTKVRLGRQQVNLDNVRFVGDIAFRQLMQVFDGLSVTTKAIPDTEIFLGHFENVRQINTKLRTEGAVEVANAKYFISPTETLVGYGYLSSMNDIGFSNGWFGSAGKNQSNKTFGLRLDGVHPFNPNLRAVYTAEYAKQTDYKGGDSAIDAHYYKIGGGVGIDFLTIRLDQELMSSNSNRFAFQTPFGTNHLFQGWVDKFLVTPRAGMKDTFLTATYRWNDVLFFADYHVFNSDIDFAKIGGGTGDKYGTEWNTAVTYNYNKNIMAKFEYGKFNEGAQYVNTTSRFRDTNKMWLTAMYSF